MILFYQCGQNSESQNKRTPRDILGLSVSRCCHRPSPCHRTSHQHICLAAKKQWGRRTEHRAFFKISPGSLRKVFRKCFRYVGVSCLSSVCGLMGRFLTLLDPDRFILADTNQMVALLIHSLSELYCSWMTPEGSVLCIR